MKYLQSILMFAICLHTLGCLSTYHEVKDFKPFEVQKNGLKIRGILRWSSIRNGDTIKSGSPYMLSISFSNMDTIRVDTIRLSYMQSQEVIVLLEKAQFPISAIECKNGKISTFYRIDQLGIENEDLFLEIKFVSNKFDPIKLKIEKDFKSYKSNKFIEYLKAR